MSAAAARRRKQLAARKQGSGSNVSDTSATSHDIVAQQLDALLNSSSAETRIDEATAYEGLQLAQSLVRKKVVATEYAAACDVCYTSALSLLKQHQRVSVASQLLTLLVQVLRETHTVETDLWYQRITELVQAHNEAMAAAFDSADNNGANKIQQQESLRLHRLQREWLRQCCAWSSDFGPIHYGHAILHKLLAVESWKLATILSHQDEQDPELAEEIMELHCDAVQHAALAEDPQQILDWLQTLPPPSAAALKTNHTCPPGLRDALLTRSVLLLVAVENLRDAHVLVRAYMATCETRDITKLTASYTSKDDTIAPAHVVFCCMLLRICQKDTRTGPLFSWLLRSFKRELELMDRPQLVLGYTTKIGKVYFNIQPPPSMLNMVENMMGMMAGGGGAGMGGMNPAMMQAALAQMQNM